MFLKEFFAGGDVERIIVDSQYLGMIEKMDNRFQGSASSSSNIKHVFDFGIVLVPLPNQSVRKSM
jgi:hypothetical protein